MSSFELFLDHARHLVRITAFGEFYQSDGEKMITTARLTAADHKYNVLYDIREATTTVNFSRWFTLPRELEVFKNRKARNVKAAILASKQDKAVKEYKFYETVTANLDINLRIFFDEKDALEWVLQKISIQ